MFPQLHVVYIADDIYQCNGTLCTSLKSSKLLARCPPNYRDILCVGHSPLCACLVACLTSIMMTAGRNSGHQRGWGFMADHHILHYVVTAAACLQVHNLIQLCKLND